MSFDNKDISAQFKEMLGVLGTEMRDTIVDDLHFILSKRNDKNQELVNSAMDAYVLALSRIIELPIGWRCVNEAYKRCNETVPEKYYEIFNISLANSENIS